MLKHADSRDGDKVSDRPSKRARLSPNGEQSGGLSSGQNGNPNPASDRHVEAGSVEVTDENVSESEDEGLTGEPERASDMYLDTVRLANHLSLRWLKYELDKSRRS